jgi:myo-inositol-1(or 4)-monophosphatase
MAEIISEQLIGEMEAVGRSAILRAGERIRECLGHPSAIETKGASDYVTDVDQACEKLVMASIHERFPDHHIMSEETPFHGWEPGITWILDPLDGTTNFIHGIPFVAVSMAALVEREPVLGLILDPVRGELFAARRGSGATLNERRIRVKDVPSLQEALIATAFPFRARGLLDPYMATFRKIFQRVGDVRRAGSAALDLAYVASGRVNGFWEAGLKPWDVAAGSLLIQEAGGRVSDFWGGGDYLENGHIVAGAPSIHTFLLEQVGAHLAPALKRA